MKSERSGRECLIVAPAGANLDGLAGVLSGAGFRCVRVATEAEAHRALESSTPTAAFVSCSLGITALAGLIARAASLSTPAPVVALGHGSTVQEAVDAMQRGAADYLPAPVQAEAALAQVKRLLGRRNPSAGRAPVAPLTGLVDSSPAMRKIASSIEKISRYKTNVLLLGESGTGKELVARALHERSPRRNHLFVPLNCATLGRDILENELFGHERGAFTGANERKSGLFEMADGGTLFLDEIGEMDVATQAKLLRVLERNEFRRVGGTTKLRVDLAVIAATNRDLEQDVDAGRFREDLYYRLKVVTIVVPPLRERPEDIPTLVETFIADFNRRNGGRIRGVSRDAMRMLTSYDWPGNVRELKNAIESAGVLASSDLLDAEGLREQLFGRLPRRAARRLTAPAVSPGAVTVAPGTRLADAEREIILAALQRCPTRAEAARSLGLGLRTLYTKLREYGMSAESAR
ncbi:MAG TPA: sigma-54 dependent transcriptional regulator [Myxococcaceae bacterium]|nr:sigma-54 dependent transcriptional regulator [Myxococcaceae bacterium]